MNELYKYITESELRGDGYFECVIRRDVELCDSPSGPTTGIARKGERWIVKKIGYPWAIAIAVFRDDGFYMAKPIYQSDTQYLINVHHLIERVDRNA